MKKSEVLTDRDRVTKLWSQAEKAMNAAKTPIAKAALKKVEASLADLFEKLDNERLNPDLKD